MPANKVPLARRLQVEVPAKLAGHLRVTQQMMAKLENPSYEPSLTQFERLAAVLRFEISYRFRRTHHD